jgi:RNA polymerase sigma-70 factor (ECF subfamily)
MRKRPRTSEARRGDFEALYQRHSREVWALAYARWLNADVATDLTQEAFYRLWREWDNGEQIGHPRAWLMRVVRNLAEDHGKSAFHRNGTQPPQLMNGVRAADPPPLEHLERQEAFTEVRRVLGELPEADRQILTLRYLLDYDSTEIAELLAVTTAAVHMRLSRARQRLAERLGNTKVLNQL